MILNANTLEAWPLAESSVQMIATSPSYWGLRDYGVEGQFGLERVLDCLGWARGENCGACYICRTVLWAREAYRVLRDDGVMFLNLGDSYARNGGDSEVVGKNARVLNNINGVSKRNGKPPAGLKHKDLCMVPARAALALQAHGWYLRQDLIWSKPNPMPESVTDRCTKAHEYIFLLTKQPRYFWNAEDVREPSVDPKGSAARYDYDFSGRPGLVMPDGKERHIAPKGKREFDGKRNPRTVWEFCTSKFTGAHFATWPPALVERMVLAGSKAGDVVLDPFSGSGTTGAVAVRLRRKYVGLELNPAYIGLAQQRMAEIQPVMLG